MKLSHGEIKALITLLGDDDISIRNLAREKLKQAGAAAEPLLRDTADSDAEGRIRIEIRNILEDTRVAALREDFAKLCRTEFDLETAVFLLAKLEYPSMDTAAYTSRLDYYTKEIEERTQNASHELERIAQLNQYLFQELNFRGNRKTYYDAENSFINRVMDRRLGIPISLSAVYLFLAKRLELPVRGVGLPGHFMVKYGDNSDGIYIDAFNRGQILSRADCERLVRQLGYTARSAHFSPSRPRDIFIRMIRNLLLIYQQQKKDQKISKLERVFENLVVKKEGI